MQIVRDLGGYTLGRSDLVRRAMSKKKQSVMEKEQANFVYGNKEENVPGCVEKGIDAKTAEGIYGTMMDFAKYAFNKSHAAAYAVVSYQTAYLKHYYPVEYMAALMTSVMDNISKVSEYILSCRNMGIQILPPDVNEGVSGFSVKDGAIRFALTAVKGVGRPVIDSLVKEREARGRYKNLNDFITRLSETELNKRVVENFIKAGAFDSIPGTRKQLLYGYVQIFEHIVKDKKNNMAGQISLFDLAGEEQKEEFEYKLPEVGEFDKEQLLIFEKEVVGVYISGHPLEEYQSLWEKTITAKTNDFYIQEEVGYPRLTHNQSVTIGGIISGIKMKYTKNNQAMAFLSVEDLVGTIEVIVFPKVYARDHDQIKEERKVFIKGRVSVEDERDGKLFAENIMGFEDVPKKLWIKFKNMEEYEDKKALLMEDLKESEGKDQVILYIEETRQMYKLPARQNVDATYQLLEQLRSDFGDENVKVV